MNNRVLMLNIFLLTSCGLFAFDESSASSSSAAPSVQLDKGIETGLPEVKVTFDRDEDDDVAPFSLSQWIKDRTKVQLGGLFTAFTATVYILYKACERFFAKTGDIPSEIADTLMKADHDILVAFSDVMIADVEHLKGGQEVDPATELFDFSEMESKQMMHEGEIVKRTFVYLYNECKEDAEKIEALEGLTATLRQDILDMPVSA